MSELIEERIHCPYCGESMSVLIESLEDSQEYIEDCQVCCQPIVFKIAASDSGAAITVFREDDNY